MPRGHLAKRKCYEILLAAYICFGYLYKSKNKLEVIEKFN